MVFYLQKEPKVDTVVTGNKCVQFPILDLNPCLVLQMLRQSFTRTCIFFLCSFHPSWPKSSVNFFNFFKSSSFTVGLDVASEFNMSACNFGNNEFLCNLYQKLIWMKYSKFFQHKQCLIQPLRFSKYES